MPMRDRSGGGCAGRDRRKPGPALDSAVPLAGQPQPDAEAAGAMRDTFRPMRITVLVLLGAIGLWLALPSVVSVLIERWLERQGYEGVAVTLGHPGLRSMTVPNVTLARRLTGEIITLSLKESQAQYTLLGLLAGRIELIVLPDLLIEIRIARDAPTGDQAPSGEVSPDAPDSFFNVLTASDLVQRIPLLPCDELRIGQVRIFREQATGPLQTVMMTGTVKQERGGLAAEVLIQGGATIPYELRVTGQSASDMLVQLRAAQPDAAPIVLWRSESVRKDELVRLKGVAEVNVKELAPFLALAVPIGSDLQQVTGSVTVHWAGTAASTVPVASLWKDAGTEVQATVQVSAALPELRGFGRDIAIKMTGTLTGNAQRLLWTVTPGTLVAARVDAVKMYASKPLQGMIRPGLQPFAVESPQEARGELFWTETPARFTATGPLTVSYGSAGGPAHVELVGVRLSGRGGRIDQAEGSFRLEGGLSRPLSERWGLKQAGGKFHGTVTLSGSEVRGEILPSSAVTFEEFRRDSVSVARGTAQLSEPLPVHFDLPSGRWKAGPGTFSLRLPPVDLAGGRVTTRQTMLRLEESEGSSTTWKIRTTGSLQGLVLRQSERLTLPMDVVVRMTADPVAIAADVQAYSQDKAVTGAAKLAHTLATGRGTLHGTLGPVTFDRASFRLRQLLTPWPYPVDVTKGTAAAAFDVVWAEDARHRARVQTGSAEVVVDRLAGQYREIMFAGLTTKVNLSVGGEESAVILDPAEVRVASMNTGVDVGDIALTVQGAWDLREALPVVEVRDFSCKLLGGVVTSRGLRADLSRPPHVVTLAIRQLDLQQVLSLEQQKGLQGTGLLDGAVPVTVTPRGISVKDGQLEARPPGGVIRYGASPETTKAVTQANANMRLVLQALSNFHYNVLQVGAQYQDDGTLNLKARLEGRNPDQKKSPPIHFNLTVQENIPALLKSLRLVQDIEDSVQKKFAKP